MGNKQTIHGKHFAWIYRIAYEIFNPISGGNYFLLLALRGEYKREILKRNIVKYSACNYNLGTRKHW